MCHVRQVRWLMATGVCLALGSSGCKDSEPPRSHYEDLATNGRALLPTSSAWHDTAVADGSADWHPFRDPPEDVPAQSGVEGGEGSAGVTAELDAEIRELFEDYNSLIGDATVDEILEYYVESQHDALRPLLVSGEKVAQSLVAIREKLETALPDASERVDEVMNSVESRIPGLLSIGELSAEDDTVIIATVLGAPNIPTCRVQLIDDEWFLEIPNMEGLAAAVPAAEAAAENFAAMVESLDAGTTPAQTVLEQLEAADSEATDNGSADGSDGG